MRMTQAYQNQQHILFIDGYFTGLPLLQSLKEKGIRVCGSIRKNRIRVANISDAEEKALQRFQFIQAQHNDTVLAVWRDQTLIRVLYNHVSPDATAVVERWGEDRHKHSVTVPQAIKDYFTSARAVDVINQRHYSYLLGRKSTRNWSRIFYWMVDICILNAFTIWLKTHPSETQLHFKEQLITELTTEHDQQRNMQREAQAHNAHIPAATEHYTIISDTDRDCKECSHQPDQRKRTRFICHACNIHLCLGDCFKSYHLKL